VNIAQKGVFTTHRIQGRICLLYNRNTFHVVTQQGARVVPLPCSSSLVGMDCNDRVRRQHTVRRTEDGSTIELEVLENPGRSDHVTCFTYYMAGVAPVARYSEKDRPVRYFSFTKRFLMSRSTSHSVHSSHRLM
jgi:hypothetical protein